MVSHNSILTGVSCTFLHHMHAAFGNICSHVMFGCTYQNLACLRSIFVEEPSMRFTSAEQRPNLSLFFLVLLYAKLVRTCRALSCWYWLRQVPWHAADR